MRMLWIKAGRGLAPWGFIPSEWIHLNWPTHEAYFVQRFPIPPDRKEMVGFRPDEELAKLQCIAFGITCYWARGLIESSDYQFVLVEGFEGLAKHSEVVTFPPGCNGRSS